jgi:leader peptidase (prepilin peptidase)/N-methyltransferase
VQSHCVSCNHKLGPLDLIPIFSYLFLGGKCRYCKEKIRSRYVLLEIMSGLAFLLLAIILRQEKSN